MIAWVIAMGDQKRFELNWPVVVLAIVVIATVVALFRPDLVRFLTDRAVEVIGAVKGIFR